MNYLILKHIIEATLVNFRCKECNSKVTEWSLNILGTAWSLVNIEVICPNCKTNWIIKAEVWVISQSWAPISLWDIKNTNTINNENIKKEVIKDSDITDIRNNLKIKNSVNDLFNN